MQNIYLNIQPYISLFTTIENYIQAQNNTSLIKIAIFAQILLYYCPDLNVDGCQISYNVFTWFVLSSSFIIIPVKPVLSPIKSSLSFISSQHINDMTWRIILAGVWFLVQGLLRANSLEPDLISSYASRWADRAGITICYPFYCFQWST